MQEHPVALEQVRDPRRVLGEPEQVVEVPALDALDDAAELLGTFDNGTQRRGAPQ